MQIYHNPRCAKSRETLKLIKESGIEPQVVEYLKNPPTPTEIQMLLAKLHLPVSDIIRTGERLYKEKFKGLNFTDDEWVRTLSENPQLMQRPIVVKENRAVIGRPPENVKELL